jgi:proteic killer suppression protein
MIRSFRNRGLKRFWERKDASQIHAVWIKRVTLVLSTLDAATEPKALDLPGLKFHALTGDMAGRYAVLVSGNWRITFAWEDRDATDVDLEDYHAR